MKLKEITDEFSELENEIWKPMLHSHYSISSHGRILTVNWKNSKKTRMILFAKDNKGYLRTGLVIEGVFKTYKVHRLVAEYFIPKVGGKNQVNHKNGIKTDNRVGNLEWVNNRENIIHAYANSLISMRDCTGENNNMAKLTEQQAKEIRLKFVPRFSTRKMLAKEYNVSPGCIKDVILGYTWIR